MIASAPSARVFPLASLAQNSGALVALAVIGILMVMIIPIPTLLLDVLLSLSIALAVIILLMAMYVLKPLDFSAFPSVLLTVTLLRLSLNIASTRLILLHGNEGTEAAGQVIKAFGTFVVGGNYVVGFIVFVVLVLINFVVITKGATRIAEVAARFTLDAMPGKQMSIDADLNAGLISDVEARQRRREIENEANFYGAMDGASKFVRGDAIAGIIIVLVNAVGGLIIGVLQKGMSLAEAGHNYTLLTIGDGLVTQVPALIVSTAAGILVTRTTASADMGEELRRQLFANPKVIATTSAILLAFAVIPGMPKFAFLLVSTGAAVLAYRLFRRGKLPAGKAEEEAVAAPAAEPVDVLVPLDLLSLEVGYGLIPLVDAQQGGELLLRIKALRKQLALEVGFIVPAIHIRDNLQLPPNAYRLSLKGVEIAQGELMPGHHLAIVPEDMKVKIPGIETHEPAFGLPAVWIPDREKERIHARGLVVVDGATVVTTHLTEIIKAHADELLGRQEVQTLVDHLAMSYPRIVEELVPKQVPIGTLQKVLQRLLRERIPIRDLLTILEILADCLSMTKNVDILTGYVRQALARTITKQQLDAEGTLNVLVLAPEIEDSLHRAIQHTEHESFLTPDPQMVRRLIDAIQGRIQSFTSRGLQPVVLCSPGVRGHLRKTLEKFFPNIAVISHNEVGRDVNIRTFGMVEL